MENPKILLESNRGHKDKLMSMGMGSKPSAKDPRADRVSSTSAYQQSGFTRSVETCQSSHGPGFYRKRNLVQSQARNPQRSLLTRNPLMKNRPPYRLFCHNTRKSLALHNLPATLYGENGSELRFSLNFFWLGQPDWG